MPQKGVVTCSLHSIQPWRRGRIRTCCSKCAYTPLALPISNSPANGRQECQRGSSRGLGSFPITVRESLWVLLARFGVLLGVIVLQRKRAELPASLTGVSSSPCCWVVYSTRTIWRLSSQSSLVSAEAPSLTASLCTPQRHSPKLLALVLLVRLLCLSLGSTLRFHRTTLLAG